MDKIETSNIISDNIYLYRHVNPLLSAKKRVNHRLPVNQVNRIELIFSNPIPLELHVESLALLAETTEKKLFKLELFLTDTEDKQRQFRIPANTNEFKLNVGFYFEEMITFKIIGYEIELFNFTSKIYFYDIYNPEAGKSSPKAHPIDSHYDVTMIPKLPVIKDVEFVGSESTSSITDIRYVNLNSKLGTKETFKMNLIMSEASNDDFEIIKFNFAVSNEQLAKKLKAEILLDRSQDDEYILTIDSFKYNSDYLSEEEENTKAEVNSLLEIKYTNASGRKNNLCHTLRVTLSVKFTPVYRVSLIRVVDLDDTRFKMTLNVRNLLQDQSFFVLTDSSTVNKIEIGAKMEHELTLDVKKLNWFEFRNRNLDLNNNPRSVSGHVLNDLINESLSLELNLNEKLSFKIKLDPRADLQKYMDRLFVCPFELRPELGVNQAGTCTLVAFFNPKEFGDQEMGRFLEGFDLACRVVKRKGLRVVANEFETSLNVS
jgi:hypothetical protein